MKDENNLIKKLGAPETMGAVNEIITDKTGTLTMNKLSVMKFYTMETIYESMIASFNSIRSSNLIAEGVLYNTSAGIERNDDG
jgi:Ca2+-transporting ATPase